MKNTSTEITKNSAAVHSIQAIANKGITNRMYLITLQDGERFILRHYQWPWPDREPLRLHKEQFVHSLLRQAGVPVPAILADVKLARQSAVLMEYVNQLERVVKSIRLS